MRLRLLLAAVAASVVVGVAPSARAAPGDSLPGYTFCGWKNFGDGSWTMTNPEDGAFVTAYASGMSCQAARRNVTRLSSTDSPPYSPRRPGYRCVRLINAYEFSSIRCVKRGGSAKFRTQTGS